MGIFGFFKIVEGVYHGDIEGREKRELHELASTRRREWHQANRPNEILRPLRRLCVALTFSFLFLLAFLFRRVYTSYSAAESSGGQLLGALRWRGEVREVFGFFVRIFETDPQWLRRVLAAGVCGLAIAGAVVLKEIGKLRFDELVAVLTMLPAFFLLAGVLLATMDTVRTRIESGAQVGWASRLFFGSLLSAWIWVAIVVAVGLPLATLIGSLTWKR